MVLICCRKPPNSNARSTFSMHHLKTKMRRLTLIFLLLAWLLFVTSQHHYSNKVMVQAIESVEFKVQTGQPSSRSLEGKVLPTWVERKKIRKSPSGPNPVGNHQPPSRH